MAEIEKLKSAKTMPKGGRKGGALFPKVNLEQALAYAKKLVSKTHTSSLPEKTILPGVFGNAGGQGKIRASALKQYGLLEGTVNAYQATKLAKEIDAAPEGDQAPLLQSAFLNSKLFKEIYLTFHGDTVAKAKIEQRAKALSVHPESAKECMHLFIESAVTAGLGTLEGDSISLVKSVGASPPVDGAQCEGKKGEDDEQDMAGSEEQSVMEELPLNSSGIEKGSETTPARNSKPGITLTLTVDPSSDPDKLEKQLKLLRQYGVI